MVSESRLVVILGTSFNIKQYACRNMADDVGVDEAFCTSCGTVIKKEAEICPECGTRQQESSKTTAAQIPDQRQYELEKITNKSTGVAITLGILLSPLGYIYLGKWGLGAINFLTLNYLLLGPIIVPIHCYKIMNDAEDELKRAGVEGY